MMNEPDIVDISDSGPKVTTLMISEPEGLPDHAGIIGLVRAHLAYFQALGPVEFKTLKGDSSLRSDEDIEYICLNEPQATLLLGYRVMRIREGRND